MPCHLQPPPDGGRHDSSAQKRTYRTSKLMRLCSGVSLDCHLRGGRVAGGAACGGGWVAGGVACGGGVPVAGGDWLKGGGTGHGFSTQTGWGSSGGQHFSIRLSSSSSRANVTAASPCVAAYSLASFWVEASMPFSRCVWI